mgnify:FL=1
MSFNPDDDWADLYDEEDQADGSYIEYLLNQNEEQEND